MSRQYEEVRMPLTEGATLLHPERALLKWEGINSRSDIGQICYLRRDTSSSSRTRCTFDILSFSSERARVVRLMVTQLSGRMTLGAMRPATISIALRVVLDFVNWADRQGLHQVLCDEKATAEAVHHYFREKREQVSLGNLNRNSVGHDQRNLLSMLREFFRNDDFCTDARVLRRQLDASVPTAVPDAEAQAALLAWADALFTSISTLVLDFKPYPVRVRVLVQISGAFETLLVNMDTLSIEKDSIPDGGRSDVPEPESGEVELAFANAMHQLDA